MNVKLTHVEMAEHVTPWMISRHTNVIVRLDSKEYIVKVKHT